MNFAGQAQINSSLGKVLIWLWPGMAVLKKHGALTTSSMAPTADRSIFTEKSLTNAFLLASYCMILSRM
jgi:hypothetical protein